MGQAFWTGLQLTAVVLVVVVVGLPITQIAFGAGNLAISVNGLISLSFFIGYAIITGILKLLVAFDLPVQLMAWQFLFLAVLAFILFYVYASKHKKKFRTLSEMKPTWDYCIALLIVILVSGIGLIIVGSFHYRGYFWWDTLYYGTHAEFLKTIPFSSLSEMVMKQPYLAVTSGILQGAHRISRGVFEAFLASVLNVDGASTIGLSSVFSVVLLFSALTYSTENFRMNRYTRMLACCLCSVLPNTILTGLEGFISVSYFTAFTVLSIKLFKDGFMHPHCFKTIVTALIVSAAFSTLLDGLYVCIALSIIAYVGLMITKQVRLKDGVHFILLWTVAFLSNLPYLGKFLDELGLNMSKQALNSLYPFAFSPQVLNWALWGKLGLIENSGVHFIYTMISITLIITGVFALIYAFVHDHLLEGMLSSALLFVPLLFVAQYDNYQYAFYKVFTLIFPLVGFGSWYFVQLISGNSCSVSRLNVDSVSAFIDRKQLLRYIGMSILTLSFSFSAYQSLQKVLVIPNAENAVSDASTRIDALKYGNSKYWKEFYSHLEATIDKNILIIAPDQDLAYWWTVYHARYNHIYLIAPENNNQYMSNYSDYLYSDIGTIPNDVMIYYSPHSYNMIQQADKLIDYAAVLQVKFDDGRKQTISSLQNGFFSDAYELRIFARQATSSKFVFTVAMTKPDNLAVLRIGENIINVQNGIEYCVDLKLRQDGQIIPIHINDNETKIEFISWKLVMSSD